MQSFNSSHYDPEPCHYPQLFPADSVERIFPSVSPSTILQVDVMGGQTLSLRHIREAVTEPDNGIVIREACKLVEGQSLDAVGHAVRVTIIRGGTSINGYYYNEQALQSIAHLIEGAQAYADHGTAEHATRSIRDIIGFYTDAIYIPPNSQANGMDYAGRVDATLHILEVADWLWSIIREAYALGRPDLIGLSVDLFGRWQLNEADNTKEITQIVALNSCDVVTRPSAGGRINRILHDLAASATAGSLTTTPSSSTPHSFYSDHLQGASTMHNMSDMSPLNNESASLPLTAGVSDAFPADTSAPTLRMLASEQVVPVAGSSRVTEIEYQQQELERMMHEVRLERSALVLERRLHESMLPQAVKENLQVRFKGRIFEEKELDLAITSATNMMARLASEGLVRGHNYEKPLIGSQITEAEKVQAAFDRMFDLDVDTARLGNIRGFGSIREAYARVTGDSLLLSGITAATTLGTIQIAEHAPVARITEADVTTASFSYLLGSSMNKRLLKDYQAWPAEWQRFCTIAPIRDFKQQTRVRLGAFGSLPIVAEDAPYSTVTLTDSAAVYVPQKRGNLVTISRETIINDDLQAIKQIPTKLAVAAAYTLAEFVYGFLSNNPLIYDGSNLFVSGAPHSNLGSTTLSSSSMQSGITSMREQTNYAGKRLGLRPRFLVVPPELEWTAMVITKSAGAPGNNFNDINPMLGYVTPIVSPQLTNANQWFLVGDPREIDTIEVGFVGGQVNPVLFIQDMPLLGLNFTQDAVTYKLRHEYGGAVVDYRGLYRGM